MATKRIYQLAKEFERDEKDIIEFLIKQGIKVANRLSAVSEDTYNMLKAKYTAPPEPEPEPEPEPVPEPPAPSEPDTPSAEQEPAPGKKKKKKKKSPQPPAADVESAEEQPQGDETDESFYDPPNESTQSICRNAIEAGNEFIKNYNLGISKRKARAAALRLSKHTDVWGIMREIKFDYPDTSPVRYWQAVNKLTTKAYHLINNYGIANRELLAEMRDNMMIVGNDYEPREIFTDEENQMFATQQKFFFRTFGHGMTRVNDNLFALKMYAERIKLDYEFMDFVEHISNPDDALRCKDRVPFLEIADEIAFSISGIARRVEFYSRTKETILKFIKNFFEWIDGYAKLKSEGAPAEKLAKYLELEKKFFDLVEFTAMENLLKGFKKVVPAEIALNLLNEYRDNMDVPDAKRNFQYKVRGITNMIFKPKEFIFLYRFADLKVGIDYRPPKESSDETAEKENPADNADEA